MTCPYDCDVDPFTGCQGACLDLDIDAEELADLGPASKAEHGATIRDADNTGAKS